MAHATVYGMMTDDEIAAKGMEFREVLSRCSQCHQSYYVELLFTIDEVVEAGTEWQGICEPCHKDLCD